MKKIFIYMLVLATTIVFFSSCDNDDVDENNSIFDTSAVKRSEFEKWIVNNYVYPYNISFKYRMEDVESDLTYDLVPAELDKSIAMAKIVKHLWLEAYDEVIDVNFTRIYIPKVIHLIGTGAYNADGSWVAGTAEGGMKVTVYNVNALDLDNINPTQLNDDYFHVIHHEFAHILHQTKNYDNEFKGISDGLYVGNNWVNEVDLEALKAGFITRYARSAVDEDFVEVFSIYVTYTAERWNRRLSLAGEGAPIINKKVELVKSYMSSKWGIDMDELREVIQRRSSELDLLDLKNI